jgi:hypothetical protein
MKRAWYTLLYKLWAIPCNLIPISWQDSVGAGHAEAWDRYYEKGAS